MADNIEQVVLKPEPVASKHSLSEAEIKEIIKAKKQAAKSKIIPSSLVKKVEELSKEIIGKDIISNESDNTMPKKKNPAAIKIPAAKAPAKRGRPKKAAVVAEIQAANSDKLTPPKEYVDNRKKLIDALDEMDRSKLAGIPNIINSDIIIFKNVFFEISSNKNEEYVAMGKGCEITYASKKDDPFNEKNRVKTTFGRYVRRNLKIANVKLPDSILSAIADDFTFKFENPDATDIKLLSGKDLTKFYKETKIRSCMTGGSSYLTKFYADNPDKIQLVVYKNQVRALLWTCDDGRKALDRIYPVGSRLTSILYKWAKKQGYLNQADLHCAFPVSVNVTSDQLPYLDTFRYGKADIKNKKIIVSPTYNGGYTELSGLFKRTREGKVLMPWHETTICSYCHYHCLKDKITKASDGKCYCDICYKAIFKTCKHCNEPFIKANHYGTTDYDNSCKDCQKKLYASCNICYRHFDKSNKKQFILAKKYMSKATKHTRMCIACAKIHCYVIKSGEDKE